MSPYLSEMKKSACRPACAPSPSSATNQGDRFRRPWSTLSYSPIIAPIIVRASLDLWPNAGRSQSVSLKLHYPRRPRTLATLVVRRWISQRRGLRKAARRSGVILTTDADSQVAPNWIAENLAAIEAGAEAVLGRINLDGEGKYLPQALHRRGRLEDAYERLLTELSWLLDPLEHNPWPHHATISGASLGITRTAYCRVGRLPRVPLGEDKALIALLSRQDARIRYCPAVRVITSGRTNGRAPGGVADTLRIRSREPEAFCDEALEPFRTAFARALWRGRLRRLHGAGSLAPNREWVRELGISARQLDDISKASAFGAAWSVIEESSQLFARQLLRPAELPAQISIARRSLARLRKGGSRARQHVQPKSKMPIRPLDDACRPHSLGEEDDSLVTR